MMEHMMTERQMAGKLPPALVAAMMKKKNKMMKGKGEHTGLADRLRMMKEK